MVLNAGDDTLSACKLSNQPNEDIGLHLELHGSLGPARVGMASGPTDLLKKRTRMAHEVADPVLCRDI